MDKYQETFNTWNKIAQLYEEKFMELDLYNDTYDLFCNLLPQKTASVFEIGCGPGNITKYLLHKKPALELTAIDVAPNMIKLAQKHNPNAKFSVMDGRDIANITEQFDGIVAGFIIPYLSKTACKQFIKNCSQLLNNNGILYLSFVAGDYKKSAYLSGSTGDRTYFYYHSLDRIKKNLEQNAFQLIQLIEKEYPRTEGTTEIHNIFLAKKTIGYS